MTLYLLLQTCDFGTWGVNCVHNCTCNLDNTLYCDTATGQCRCRPGFQGATCSNVCPKGTYGTNCQGKEHMTLTVKVRNIIIYGTNCQGE